LFASEIGQKKQL